MFDIEYTVDDDELRVIVKSNDNKISMSVTITDEYLIKDFENRLNDGENGFEMAEEAIHAVYEILFG